MRNVFECHENSVVVKSKKNPILLVTANENETDALLKCNSFLIQETRHSDDARDATIYNIGTLGCYSVVHFELVQEGSVGSNASQLAIANAIDAFAPKAVILVGVAFGKRNENDENPSQEIGDVLISTQVADYLSGKVKDGELQSDAPRPEAGSNLVAAFKYFSRTWKHDIDGRKADREFGLILSGDMVVDDEDFKRALFKMFSRAIGGEMEGRGAYAACDNKQVREWIIVKGICDWADGTKGRNKQENQVKAAESAVSLVEHVFLQEIALEQLYRTNKDRYPENQEDDINFPNQVKGR